MFLPSKETPEPGQAVLREGKQQALRAACVLLRQSKGRGWRNRWLEGRDLARWEAQPVEKRLPSCCDPSPDTAPSGPGASTASPALLLPFSVRLSCTETLWAPGSCGQGKVGSVLTPPW